MKELLQSPDHPNPRATKIDVAVSSFGDRFEQLRDCVPRRPARATLGLWPREQVLARWLSRAQRLERTRIAM